MTRPALTLLAGALCAAGLAAREEEPAEPVTFTFTRMSGPAGDRKAAYDAKADAYFLKVSDIARFEVKAVAADLEERRVVLNISGMLDKPEGKLTLYLPEKDKPQARSHVLYHEGFDKELFKIERKDGVTAIEFLPKGKELLKAGVWFQYIDFYRQ
jgi:hypothetical protein